MVVLALVLVVALVTVVSAVAITAGGAATVALATLDQDLPDVRAFRDLDFKEQSVMYSRDGVRLAEFWDDRRDVIDNFDQIPQLVLDATTATEDDTFWDNPGVDLQATIGQFLTVAGGGDGRGASTITQQLVRAVLLPKDIVQNQYSSKEALYTRKAMEILQSYKLTQAFPGEQGKQEIIKAYLNEINYGGAVNGIKAAAKVYLGKSLGQLTLAEAALLAAIPQEPANLYPFAKDPKTGKYTNIVKEAYGKKNKKTGKQPKRLIIRQCGNKPNCTDTALVRRQQFILNRLAEGKGRWVKPTAEQVAAAKAQKIVIRPERAVKYKAPQFVAAARAEVERILGNDYDPIQVGGYTITTTLDYRAQKIGEKYIWAGAVAPHLPISKYYKEVKARGVGGQLSWMNQLRALGVYSGALVAMDYRNGDILAYVASPGYYRKTTPKVDSKFDHIGIGRRQPGSAWKPIVYATGIETHALTAASVLLDITTPFGGISDSGGAWVPKNAEKTDSGPILVRDALQQSLNVPAIRALNRTGVETVRKYAVKAGFSFLPQPLGFGNKSLDAAGLAGAIGTVEVRPLDMVRAFGAFGDGGKVMEPRYVLEIKGPKGEIIYKAGQPAYTQVWSPQTAYIISEILAGNSDPKQNPAWAAIFATYNTKNGARRELAVKTGTNNNLKDYSTYGYLPKPKNSNLPALAVGVWYGNSNSYPANVTSPPVYSLTNAGNTWQAFVNEYTKNKPAPKFQPPPRGITTATVRLPSGGARVENFISGTQPGGKNQVDPVYSCSTPINSLENANATWPSTAVNSWAARGSGSLSQWGTVKIGGACYSGGGSSSSSGGGSSSSSSGGGGSSGGSSGGGGNSPSPTCQPGFTDKPKGCVIPG